MLEIQNNLGRAITTSTSKWTSSEGVTTIGPATIASGSSKEFSEISKLTFGSEAKLDRGVCPLKVTYEQIARKINVLTQLASFRALFV